MSIKKEMFRNGVLLTLTITLLFGGFFSAILYYVGFSSAMQILRERNRAVSYFIDSHFSKIHNTVNFLASEPLIVHAMELGISRKNEVLRLYRALELSDRDINYIYSGYENGRLLINNYSVPPGFDPRVRPWYRAALEAAPKSSGGVPYREYKSKEWLVSISKALRDESNRTTGVVSIDSSVDRIEKILKEQVGSYRSSYSFVVNPSGRILLHPDSKWLGKNLSELLGSRIVISKHASESSQRLATQEWIFYYHAIDSLGWIVITLVKRNEIVMPIVLDIAWSILVIGVVAVLLSRILSARLSGRIVEPFEHLEKRVRQILSGKVYAKDSYSYPDNEIGSIAREIEALTQQELYRKNRALRRANTKLELLSVTDRLTGLYNRRKMNRELKREWVRTRRYGRRFSLMMLDIDWFKAINDTYGHAAGDAVLKTLARILRRTLRKTDFPARWGGEEFLILLPETDLASAKLLAEKIRRSIEEHAFGGGIKITVSIGVHEYQGEETVKEAIERTDAMLYTAKNRGRNRVATG